MMKLRKEVLAFAELMERQLRQNDYKGKTGWKDCQTWWLADKFMEEAMELRDVVRDHQLGTISENLNAPSKHDEDYTVRDLIAMEAADAANMAMMIADVCGCLPPTDKRE